MTHPDRRTDWKGLHKQDTVRIAALEAEQDELTAMLRLTLRHTYAASVKDEAQLGRLIDDRIAALRKWVRLTP